MNNVDAHQLRQLARFLNDHPAFAPTFFSSFDNAVLCGFQVGESCLTLDEMLQLVDTPGESYQPALAGYVEWAGGL
jgi:hypothetical protein